MSTPAELQGKLRQIQSGRNDFVDMLQSFDDYIPELIQEMVSAHANDAGWIERNARKTMESRDPSVASVIQHAREEERFGKFIKSLHDDKLKRGQMNFNTFKAQVKKENDTVTQTLRNLRSNSPTPNQSQNAPPPRGQNTNVNTNNPPRGGAPITES